MDYLEKINETAAFLKAKGIEGPDAAVILGTGLGQNFVSQIEMEHSVPYDDIPNFPVSTVEFHHGKLIFGKMAGKKVLAFQGRFHYYEGYDLKEVTFLVRIAKALGSKYLFISNAAGCLDLSWNKGDLMLLDDHIDLLPDNPLRGRNFDDLGPRFPDMSRPYDKGLNQKMEQAARGLGITLRKGVYAAVPGPNLETRAEYRYLRTIGADAVGMSTVPEVIVANHAGLPCCAVSVLTDDCDPDNLHPINIEDIIKIANGSEKELTRLFVEVIREL